jgi:amino acid transporter
MAMYYFLGVVRITNFLIAMFICFYAFLFLMKTAKRSERRPWDYLFLSSLIYLIYQLVTLVQFFGEAVAVGNQELLQVSVEFLYSGLVLLAFVSQHDLILRHPLILISRKRDDE